MLGNTAFRYLRDVIFRKIQHSAQRVFRENKDCGSMRLFSSDEWLRWFLKHFAKLPLVQLVPKETNFLKMVSDLQLSFSSEIHIDDRWHSLMTFQRMDVGAIRLKKKKHIWRLPFLANFYRRFKVLGWVAWYDLYIGPL